MRNTRLFIYKQPEIHNVDFAGVKPDTNGGYYDEWWTIPTATTFTAYGLVPYPDDVAGTYAIHQNFGLTGAATIKLGVVVDGDHYTAAGAIDISIGNRHITITQPGTVIYDFEVNTQDATFGYDVVIRGSGGTYFPGNPVANMGIKSVYIVSAQTQEYQEVDLFDNVDIPITYNVGDVRDISKKDSNYSLTVELPNTKNNAILFDYIHEIADYASSFELLKQYPAYIDCGTYRTFEGYLKLNKVKKNKGCEIVYECNLYSNFVEFVKRLGTTTLRGNDNPLDDLSFSEYTKQLTVVEDKNDPNYPGTWFEKTDMFVWDRTDPNNWVKTGEKPYGEDFYFAPVDKFNLGTRMNLLNTYVPLFFDEMTPFLFIKEIWDKIFEQAGFSYVSAFLTDDAANDTDFSFSHLVYPAANFRVGTDKDIYSIVRQTTTQAVIANSVYSYNFTRSTTIPYPLDGANGYVQTYTNQFNYLTVEDEPAGQSVFAPVWEYTAPKTGVYSFDIKLPWDIWLQLRNINGADLSYTANIDFDTNATYFYDLSVIFEHNGQYRKLITNNSGIVPSNYSSNYQFIGGLNQFGKGTLEGNLTLSLDAGDKLYIMFDYDFQVGGMQNGQYKAITSFYDAGGVGYNPMFYPKLQFLKSEMNEKQVEIRLLSEFTPNGVFDPTVILNEKTRKVDFINNIIKKFNLYIEDVTNKTDANGYRYSDYPNVRKGEPILLIEPRDLYYSLNQRSYDLTNYVDYDTAEFTRIDDYLYNRLIFNDKDDSTYHTKDYNAHNYTEGEYGEEIITSPFNISNDDKTEITTTFGQTMCGRLTGNGVRLDKNLYTQCPFLFTLNDSGEVMQDKDYNDRMLFVYNLYPQTPEFQAVYTDSSYKGWDLYRRSNIDYNTFNPNLRFPLNIESYCLLDHINIPFGYDTADLNWGWANWYYQYLTGNPNSTWVTSNNCYNRFYKQMIEDYNDPNARLLTCYMYLPPVLIYLLKLSDTIIIKDMAYHINKIQEWKNGDELTKVELIKILSPATRATKIIPDNNEEVPDDDDDIVPAKGVKGETTETTYPVKMEKVNRPPAVHLPPTTQDNKTIEQLESVIKELTERLERVEKNETR